MSTTGRLRLTIEVERGLEPIEGRLVPGRGPGQPFRGWIELVSVIETACTAAALPDRRDGAS
jgi:hypothetical protein